MEGVEVFVKMGKNYLEDRRDIMTPKVPKAKWR